MGAGGDTVEDAAVAGGFMLGGWGNGLQGLGEGGVAAEVDSVGKDGTAVVPELKRSGRLCPPYVGAVPLAASTSPAR